MQHSVLCVMCDCVDPWSMVDFVLCVEQGGGGWVGEKKSDG